MNGGPAITAGESAGTLLLTFSNNDTVYYDNNYPGGLGVGSAPGDGGNMVDINSVIQSGPKLATGSTVGPGTFVVVGYQSTSAINAQAGFGITEFFLNDSTGITLPGISYTSLSNQYVTGQGPKYGFNNLSVMGMTGSGFVNGLYLTTGITSTTFGVTYAVPTSTVQITGVTYDVSGAFLSYTTGTTLSVDNFALPLVGTVAVTAGDGSVTVTISGGKYGDSTNFTLHTSTSEFSSNDIVVTGGSGSYTYTKLIPGTVYSSSAFTYGVVIPSGISSNKLTPSIGVTVDGPTRKAYGPSSSTQLSLDYVFSADVGQTFTFNLLGEAVPVIAYDQTITLDVPISTMNKVLGYASNWESYPGSSGTTGSQPQPVVALMIKEFLSYPLDDFSKGLTGTMVGITFPSNSLGVITGDEGTTCTSLIYQFQSVSGFTYHASGGDVGITTDYLSNIPQEAITSFTLSPINTIPLTSIVGNLIDVGDGPLTTTPYAEAIQSLFEQAVAAGLVQTSAESAGFSISGISTKTVGYGTVGEYFAAAGSTADVYGAQWLSGQELAIYVQYNLVKHRSYRLSPLANLGATGATGATQLNFGGITFSLSGLTEDSLAVPVTYKIVLHAVGEQQKIPTGQTFASE